jgi:phage FluMu protein Com
MKTRRRTGPVAGKKRPPDGKEIRCSGCGSLLAKLERGTLNLQRGDLQASFDGIFHGSIVCYRARCKKLNVVQVSE